MYDPKVGDTVALTNGKTLMVHRIRDGEVHVGSTQRFRLIDFTTLYVEETGKRIWFVQV